MRARSIAVGALAALTATVLVACGSSTDDSPAPKADETTSVAPTATSQPPSSTSSSTVPAPETPSGLVLGKCLSSGTQQQLDFVDPATGQINETRYFVLEYEKYHAYGLCGSMNGSGYELRSAYDAAFHRLAAHAVLDDDAYHVGFVSASESTQNTTEFVDLSGVTEDGFSVPTQQSPGAFGPDGRLYFVQDISNNDDVVSKLMAVDPDGGAPQEVSASKDISNVNVAGGAGGPASNWGLYFPSGATQPRTDPDYPVVFSPDGSWMIQRDRTDGHLLYGSTGSKLTETEVSYEHSAPIPFQYISKMSYYGISDDGSELVLATIQGGKVTTKSLLPPTDGKISEPTLSPDGATIAFILRKDDSHALYTVTATGGQPTKVEDLEPYSDVFILDWLA